MNTVNSNNFYQTNNNNNTYNIPSFSFNNETNNNNNTYNIPSFSFNNENNNNTSSYSKPSFSFNNENNNNVPIFSLSSNINNANDSPSFSFDNNTPSTDNLVSSIGKPIITGNLDPEKSLIVLGQVLPEDKMFIENNPIESFVSLSELFPDFVNEIHCGQKDFENNNYCTVIKNSKSEVSYSLYGKVPEVNHSFKPFKPKTDKEKLLLDRESFILSKVKYGRVSDSDEHYTGAYLRNLAKKLNISSVGGKGDLINKISKEYGLHIQII